MIRGGVFAPRHCDYRCQLLVTSRPGARWQGGGRHPLQSSKITDLAEIGPSELLTCPPYRKDRSLLDFTRINSETRIPLNRQPQHFQPMASTGSSRHRFYRMLTNRDKPDLVQRKRVRGRFGYYKMAKVDWVKRAAKNADSHWTMGWLSPGNGPQHLPSRRRNPSDADRCQRSRCRTPNGCRCPPRRSSAVAGILGLAVCRHNVFEVQNRRIVRFPAKIQLTIPKFFFGKTVIQLQNARTCPAGRV